MTDLVITVQRTDKYARIMSKDSKGRLLAGIDVLHSDLSLGEWFVRAMSEQVNLGR